MSRKTRPRIILARMEWGPPRRPPAGIFGIGRDFPITTKELATLQKKQLELDYHERPAK